MSRKYLVMVFILSACSGESSDVTDVTDDNVESGIQTETLSPVDFNNEISFMQEGVLAQIDILFKSDSTNIDLNYKNTIFEIDLNISGLEVMKYPADGTDLKNAMLDFLNFYKTELEGGFERIIELIKKPDWTDAEAAEVDAYDLKFAESEKGMFEKVLTEQEKFAKANRIELQEL